MSRAAACCRCCEAAGERGELDHELGDCPYPPCDYHGLPEVQERGW